MNTLTGLLAAAVVALTLYQHAQATTRRYADDPPVNYRPRGCPEYPQPCYWQRPPHDPAKDWRWEVPRD